VIRLFLDSRVRAGAGFGQLQLAYSGWTYDGGETDGGKAGRASIFWKGAETAITAAIWRLDPRSENPTIDVFAHGIRNAWSFAWNDRGDLFSASNGPDAEVPEELDFVERGKHYGFPYQYGRPSHRRPALPLHPGRPARRHLHARHPQRRPRRRGFARKIHRLLPQPLVSRRHDLLRPRVARRPARQIHHGPLR